jgi:hypothetical protein
VPENNAWVLLPKRERILPLLQQAVDVLSEPAPVQSGQETRVAELLATPTETPVPESEAFDTPTPEMTDEAPAESVPPADTQTAPPAP